MDFFKITTPNIKDLSETERSLFNYTVKNIYNVKSMTIRELANANYVSTTTVFRFVKKLGFNSYRAFSTSLELTESKSREITVPDVMLKEKYISEYLKNVIEAVKVIDENKLELFKNIMIKNPKIYILATGLSEDIASYLKRMLVILGYEVETPVEEYEIKSTYKRIKQEDVLIVLSYTGDNVDVANYVEQILTVSTPKIISITRADNNIIQNLSDLNFYVFADEIEYDNMDLTSRCGMLAVIETLIHSVITSLS